MPGYSGKSLRDKLGLHPGSSTVFLFAPLSYIESLGEISDIEMFPVAKENHDFIHFFVREKKMLMKELPILRKAIKQNGVIWVSWPKRSSKAVTDITEDTIREACLPLGLVDIKVAAIDETWSGLKLVLRLSNRH